MRKGPTSGNEEGDHHCRKGRESGHGLLLSPQAFLETVAVSVHLQEMEKHGVTIEAVTEDIDSSDLGKLISYIRGYASKLEAAKIRERTMQGKKEHMKRGSLPQDPARDSTATPGTPERNEGMYLSRKRRWSPHLEVDPNLRTG
jgi:hypothetical protein